MYLHGNDKQQQEEFQINKSHTITNVIIMELNKLTQTSIKKT